MQLYRLGITCILVGSFFLSGTMSFPQNLKRENSSEPSPSALLQNPSSTVRIIFSTQRDQEMGFFDRNCPCSISDGNFHDPLPPPKCIAEDRNILQKNPLLSGGLFRLNCLLLI
jgi:hypothetical protein